MPWWNKRTRMERRFLVFAGALTVVAIAMGAGLILLARDKVRKTKETKITINSNFVSAYDPI